MKCHDTVTKQLDDDMDHSAHTFLRHPVNSQLQENFASLLRRRLYVDAKHDVSPGGANARDRLARGVPARTADARLASIAALEHCGVVRILRAAPRSFRRGFLLDLFQGAAPADPLLGKITQL